jgi:hypothetical protein
MWQKPNNLLSLKNISRSIGLAALCIMLVSCKKAKSPIPETNEQVFSDYWYNGEAEINSYELSQSRYGGTHDGSTVLVFVAEDFSKSKHVKLDEPHKHKSDAVRIIKLNTSKEFVTGIYKYTMMNSVYMPVDHKEYPHSLKLTSSTLEWCGQSFMQSNWKGNRYEVQEFSYFESEGDSKYSLANGWLEDELWTLIRIAPNTLPIGEIKMITSASYVRLAHCKNKVYDAMTSLISSETHYTYSIHYPELKRTLDIDFETAFPYKILGWREVTAENEITTGRLLKTVMSDYWNKHQPSDEILRDSLNLN